VQFYSQALIIANYW